MKKSHISNGKNDDEFIKIFIGIWGVILLSAMAIGTFFDEQISYKLYGLLPTLSQIADTCGELPCFLFSAFCCAIVARYMLICSTVKKTPAVIFFLFINVLGAWLAFIGIYSAVKNIALSVVLSTGAQIIAVLTSADIKKEKTKRYAALALSTLLSIFIAVTIAFIAKKTIMRPRFYTVLYGNSIYSPWYKQGTGGASFFSGHALMTSLMLLCMRFVDTGIKKRGLFILVFTLYSVVSFARISIGAHYLSDVSFAGLTSLGIFIVCTKSFDPLFLTVVQGTFSHRVLSQYRRYHRKIKLPLSFRLRR